MARESSYIKIEGLKEFQRAARNSADRDLPKRLGDANKSIGELVISRLSPRPTDAAVGQGAGSAVRASASKREVLLRVGGAHRASASPQMQWGRKPGRRPGEMAPKRPYIKQTMVNNEKFIYAEWLKAVSKAMDPAFAKTEP